MQDEEAVVLEEQAQEVQMREVQVWEVQMHEVQVREVQVQVSEVQEEEVEEEQEIQTVGMGHQITADGEIIPPQNGAVD